MQGAPTEPAPAAPTARAEPVYDTAFGLEAADPYRWMEQWHGEEMQAWLRAQAAHCRATLDTLPGLEQLRQRIRALGDAQPKISGLFLAGQRCFYLRRESDASQARLIMRDGPDAPEASLLDPTVIDPAAAIDWYMPSWDGAFVACGISTHGSEDSTLFVVDAARGLLLDLAISRTQFGDVYWLRDNRSFVYRRFPAAAEGRAPTERYFDSQVLLHRLGDDPEQDCPVFGSAAGVQECGRADFPMVVVSPASPWAIGVVIHGAQPELSLYAAPAEALERPGPIPWRMVVDRQDGVTGFDLAGAQLYLKTHHSAPRYRVLALDLDAAGPAQMREVVPQSAAVIEDLLVAGEDLIVRTLDGGVGRLWRYPRTGGAGAPLATPIEGTIAGWAYAQGRPELLVQLASWTEAPQIYRYHLERHVWTNTGWCPPGTADTSTIRAYQISAVASDGTAIPISLIHRRDLALDGDNPTLLVAYGAYGICLRPAYSPAMLAWYERGGVYAVAHIRGGGEYGAEWHAAACGPRKALAADDLICCAEALIDAGYTRPERLAAQGTSAGAVPVGVAMARRPDLWGAVIIRNGLTNPLRLEACEGGAANLHEFGPINDAQGWMQRRAIDTCALVQDGRAYPAVLLTGSLNDARVPVWQVAKLAARLQAASGSGRPVLLRIDFEGGHGWGASREQEDAELADRLAFLLAQIAGGEPRPA
ncbi:MAG TPA: prolyl oligopeptidase family serine peptidase [Roseiflexaceae bacterium]|nr:prolyl oligopeptidase family serine peptidase [Roseiflexaceae bacterium]